MDTPPEEALREDYNYERDRRQAVYSRISAPVTIAFGLGAALWYLLREFTYNWWDVYTVLFILMSIGAGLWYLVALWKVRDYIELQVILSPSSVLWKEVKAKHEDRADQIAAYQEELEVMTETLHTMNNRRDGTLRSAYRYFGITFVFMFLAAFIVLIQ